MHLYSLGSSEGSSMWRALIAWGICFVVTIVVSLFTKRKPDIELRGLVYSLTPKAVVVETVWYKKPLILAGVALVILIMLNIIFF
jgi:SSS family solute:Na+ symporter